MTNILVILVRGIGLLQRDLQLLKLSGKPFWSIQRMNQTTVWLSVGNETTIF